MKRERMFFFLFPSVVVLAMACAAHDGDLGQGSGGRSTTGSTSSTGATMSFTASGSSSTTYDASGNPGGGQNGDGGDATVSPPSDAATTSPLDALFPDDVPVAAQCVPSLPLEPDGAAYPNPLMASPGPCAMSSAGPFSPPGSATGTDIVGIDGQPTTIVDGYALLNEGSHSDPLSTSYSSSLSFTFTNFSNALGYAIEGATKGGSRVVQLGGPQLLASSGYPQFTVGSYTMESGSGGGILYAFSPLDGTHGCTWQTAGLGVAGPSVLNITAISTDRIQGTLAVQGDAHGVAIHFDIPLLVLCGSEGVQQIAVECCLP